MYILSFDIEDWFHIFHPAYEDQPDLWENLSIRVDKNTKWVLDFLEKNSLKATFFCMGWVVDKHPQLIKTIHASGHEIAAHSYLHNKVFNQTAKQFHEDTKRVVESLQNLTGIKITSYRAPGFSMNKNTLWAFEILNEFGIENDSSFKSGLHMGFKKRIPNEPFILKGSGFEIKEFPTRTFNLFGSHLIYSGSGYFRLYPYFFTKWALGKINNKYKKSFVFYLHPWEIDPDQPKIDANFLSKFRHYNNLAKCESRLQKLLGDFHFTTVRDVLSQLNLLGQTERIQV